MEIKSSMEHFLSQILLFLFMKVKVKLKAAQSCLTLCDPMDCIFHGSIDRAPMD